MRRMCRGKVEIINVLIILRLSIELFWKLFYLFFFAMHYWALKTNLKHHTILKWQSVLAWYDYYHSLRDTCLCVG